MLANIASQVQAQSISSIVGGFSFAAAIAWMDAIRWMIASLIKINRNGGTYHLITALLTTLLAVLVFTIINALTKDELEKPNTMFAVTR